MTFTIRSPIIFLALFLIKLSRDRNSTVNYSQDKTLGLQISKSIISKRFITTWACYIISSLLLSLLFVFQIPLLTNYYVISKEYELRPKLNDEWIYYWFFPFYLSFVYSSQHLVFQRNRLEFTYGISKVEPKDALLTKIPELLTNSIVVNVATVVSSPIVYWFCRGIIYRANWLNILIMGLDTSIPPYHISLKTAMNLCFFSGTTIAVWELSNHSYNVYATIGCLDGKKPISTYSSDPVNTLLIGLRNTDPEWQLARLSAFQELAYVATNNGPEAIKLRSSIYNAHSKGGYIWTSILDECSLIIKETSMKINYRNSVDLKVIKQGQDLIKEDGNTSFQAANGSNIFGNSFISSPNNNINGKSNIRDYNEIANDQSSNVKHNDNQYLELIQAQIIDPFKSFMAKAISNDSQKSNSYILGILNQVIKTLLSVYDTYRKQFLATYIGMLFRVTLKRDTESRVVNPVNYGNAVIALSNFIMKAVEEDKNGTISNRHISEVLNLLESPIRACSNYNDYLPPSVYLTINQKKNKDLKKTHVITLLHDLTMKEFYDICLKYNYKLNDLLLSSRSFKLAKWVIDVAIAQQQQEMKTSNKVDTY